jgi:hypothetical protein
MTMVPGGDYPLRGNGRNQEIPDERAGNLLHRTRSVSTSKHRFTRRSAIAIAAVD